ncbi:hypothetical protein E5288_WYG015565 [Bos mutus]|uniref:Uncharacterized protein n=1 Tax=Bos mutus TaxID=72004 RepID=A0A6B0RVP7_9CETA|nr:hypothetical protein [Bos mutus]
MRCTASGQLQGILGAWGGLYWGQRMGDLKGHGILQCPARYLQVFRQRFSHAEEDSHSFPLSAKRFHLSMEILKSRELD